MDAALGYSLSATPTHPPSRSGTVIALLEGRRDELVRLCAQYRVRRLELFGSAARGDFAPERSDLDFLVEFDELELDRYAEHYFGLLFALEDLFGLRVDLVMLSAVRNPYFLQEIEAARTVLYAAA
jgi:hypothetical protein